MFDESADGYGRGEGIAVVCLKRLDAALKDGDHVECIIRETGTNQDGRTKGITMPSAEAQAALIRKTYRSAGLDPAQVGSRPSYFEAHGTGTRVGDPLEAEAVQAAFFPSDKEYADDDIMYIGSVKTIIGHTEGTAGIAGLLRAALAVRYGFIPPNLGYTRMNPAVTDHAKHLRIVTAANPWPALPAGCPRRASINSFGFGGSNVHVILESFERKNVRRGTSTPSFGVTEPIFTPFTFSGASERAVIEVIKNYLKYLEDPKTTVSLRDFAWTLQYKRSQFTFRHAISAISHDELIKGLRDIVQSGHSEEAGSPKIVRRSQSAHPRIMGVFTGQGAQWAGMGKELIEQSPFAFDIISKLDEALASLPPDVRPTWKIKDELVVEEDRSRIGEAELSQPLTTAIQLLLVDLLDIAGIRLHTVVGHSSGEIAAAYAAGMINAEDAIRTAFYRGYHAKHAASQQGKPGSMMFAALTPEQATTLCELAQFRGRLVVACFNGPTIVTLSGDSDAVDEALEKLNSMNLTARKLNVAKAYHSHHMRPCAEPYRRSLQDSTSNNPPPLEDSPMWFSSVRAGRRMDRNSLVTASYWVNNLLEPVRFSDAITTAISEAGVPDLFLEVGPHPQLQKPITQILASSGRNGTVYCGLLRRGLNSINTVSQALGEVWMRFGRTAVNFTKFEMTLSGGPHPVMAKELPTYPWIYDREYWWENRFLRRRFQAVYPPNELLGEEFNMGAQHETKWRSFLQPKDVPWLLDHKLNGVAVLPGAAYVAMAVTAARRIWRKQKIVVIDVQELSWKLPLTFPDDHTSIETVLTVDSIQTASKQGRADFVFDFCSHQRQDELMTAAKGRLVVHFGEDADRNYPQGLRHHSPLTELDVDDFYQSLDERGYGYTGPFKSIDGLHRRIDFSTGKMTFLPSDMTFHPAMLDGLFQATFAAEGYPRDSAMPDFRVPSLVRSIKVFPTRCDELSTQTTTPATFQITKSGASEFCGHITGDENVGVAIQIQGFATAPFKMSTPDDDVKMFSEVQWRPYIRDARSLTPWCVLASHAREPAIASERVALYYLTRLNELITLEEERNASSDLRSLCQFARLFRLEYMMGMHPHLDPSWKDDTEDVIKDVVAEHSGLVNMRLVDAVGKAYPQMIRGQLQPLDILMEDSELSRLYEQGLGFREANTVLARLVKAISDQYPSMHILEVGAGTGSATGAILPLAKYSSYTYTDVSPAFFGKAKEKFKRHLDKMAFTVLDLEKDPEQQGFIAESFEVVIASNVLHAVTDLKTSLERVRRLLRPGGFLACIELPETDRVSSTVIMGGLNGWWSRASEEGTTVSSPAFTETEWDDLLKETGFTGLDAITPLIDDFEQSYRVFVTQAVDESVRSFRQPLRNTPPMAHRSLLIIGAGTHPSLNNIIETVSPFFEEVISAPSFDDLAHNMPIPDSVLSLVELGDPICSRMTASRLATLQKLLSEGTDVLWVTTRCKNPATIQDTYRQMMVGLGRTIQNEFTDLRLRFFDVGDLSAATPEMISQAMLEWCMLGKWQRDGALENLLIPRDTELAMEKGIVMAPSLIPTASMNDRFNSQQRRVVHQVDPHKIAVRSVFSPPTKMYDVQYETYHGPHEVRDEYTIVVKMLYTTLYALKFKKVGFLILGLGVCPDGKHALIFSEQNSSVLRLHQHAVYPCESTNSLTKESLWATAAHIVAERVVGASSLTSKILVMVSNAAFMPFILARAIEQNKTVVFITSNSELSGENMIFLHPNALDIQIRQTIPSQVGLLVNLSNNPEDIALFKRVTSILSDSCTKTKSVDTVFLTSASRYGYTDSSAHEISIKDEDERHILAAEALSHDSNGPSHIQLLSPNEVSQHSFHDPLAILDWTSTSQIPVTIQPATATAKFSAHKTYVIIGTSDVCQSICELLVNNGARHVVMASRNPPDLAGWLLDLRLKGAQIDIRSADVTDAQSVAQLFAAIRASAASHIAGVIHLGLYLKDTSFMNMSLEDLQLVTDVKAKGSLILHEETLQDKLDFFILTGSISYVAGNPGQANYNAGNAFIGSLARYRRRQGLPASVVHLGRVTGLGYIARMTEGRTEGVIGLEYVRQKRVYPISERDLHQIYAEAVLASPADSKCDPEIITGFCELTADKVEGSPWVKQPIFANLITEASRGTAAIKPKPQVSVRERLNEEFASPKTDSEESLKASLREIVRTGLKERLGVLVQVDAGTIDESVSLLDMGIDSLVASEVGSWARKELRVQVPHSMIFGGSSITEIVEFAVAHLDKGWVMKGNGVKGTA